MRRRLGSDQRTKNSTPGIDMMEHALRSKDVTIVMETELEPKFVRGKEKKPEVGRIPPLRHPIPVGFESCGMVAKRLVSCGLPPSLLPLMLASSHRDQPTSP